MHTEQDSVQSLDSPFEPCHKRQMVAESPFPFWSLEIPQRLLSAILLIVFEQERLIDDTTVVEPIGQGLAHEDMVEASPFSTEFVRAFCPIFTFCPL